MKYVLWFWVFTTYPQGEWHKFLEPSLEKCFADLDKEIIPAAPIQECHAIGELPEWKANK